MSGMHTRRAHLNAGRRVWLARAVGIGGRRNCSEARKAAAEASRAGAASPRRALEISVLVDLELGTFVVEVA